MSNSKFWKPFVRQIVDSEEVNATIANRASQDQSAREDYLYTALQNLSTTSGRLVRTGVAVSDTTEQGDVVYYSTASEKFEPALAEVIYIDGLAVSSVKSFAVGIALNVSAGFGDIILFGHVLFGTDSGEYNIDPLTLLDTQASSFSPGIYYLSRKVAGKISSTPSAPNVQLGTFFNEGFLFAPIYKDLSESHFHYVFDLQARPAASQNYSATNSTGWYEFASNPGIKRVDYFNNGVNTTHPNIIATIRWTGLVDPAPTRVDLYRSSAGKFVAKIYSGVGLSYTDPASLGADLITLSEADFPDYGEYVAIGSTGLEVAFLRQDSDYSNSLTVDANALLTLNTDKFKFFLPNDLYGWTNANELDTVTTPYGTLYQYVLESNRPLLAAYPPLPLESAIIENNGVSTIPDQDFIVSVYGVWWIPSGDASPWPTDFTANSVGMVSANARNIRLHFSKTTSGNSKQVVSSLKSLSDSLVVAACPSGDAAESGPLSIKLELKLAQESDISEGYDIALVEANGENFKIGPVVSELVAGPGIELVRESVSLIPNSTRFTGKVRVQRKDVNMEGEVSSIALRNAKEVIKDSFAYVSFPAPAKAPSSIIARFKVPESGMTNLQVNLFAQALGSLGSSSARKAKFKLTYQAVRPGFLLSDLQESSALSVQYWTISFPTLYPATQVLAEFPPNDEDYKINTVLIDAYSVGTSPVLPDGIEDGDIISVTIERVLADGDGDLDDYPGEVGLAGLRWSVKA